MDRVSVVTGCTFVDLCVVVSVVSTIDTAVQSKLTNTLARVDSGSNHRSLLSTLLLSFYGRTTWQLEVCLKTV